jgi:hypothetical protein
LRETSFSKFIYILYVVGGKLLDTRRSDVSIWSAFTYLGAVWCARQLKKMTSKLEILTREGFGW